MTMFAGIGLTTLEAVKEQLKLTTTDDGDDVFLQHLIVSATDMMHQFCIRSFLPSRATKQFDARGDEVTTVALHVWDDLLEVISITNGDGTSVASGAYVLNPRNEYPKWGIELLPSSVLYWTYNTDWQGAISVDAIWGYHEDYAHAWIDTRDTVQNAGGIDATTQTITVVDADGKDARYRTRFQIGQLIRVDDEFMDVVDVDIVSNTLTVLRGQAGTVAATHANAASITRWAAMQNVEQACISLVSWLYRTAQTAGEEIQFLDGTRIITNRAPSNIRETLLAYRKGRIA